MHTVIQSRTREAARLMIAKAFPQETIENFELLAGGLINTNLKVQFASRRPPVVLRVYRDGADVCRKEVALHELIHTAVPLAEIIYAEADSAFAILDFVDGLTFQELKRTKNTAAIQQAVRSVGETLAAIGRFAFYVA